MRSSPQAKPVSGSMPSSKQLLYTSRFSLGSCRSPPGVFQLQKYCKKESSLRWGPTAMLTPEPQHFTLSKEIHAAFKGNADACDNRGEARQLTSIGQPT
eukprot:scaffold247977_cov13-Tisochrysis_lutea.AAC.1